MAGSGSCVSLLPNRAVQRYQWWGEEHNQLVLRISSNDPLFPTIALAVCLAPTQGLTTG